MASSHRTSTDSLELLRDLEENAHKYDFFQTLRLIECSFRDNPRIGKSQRAHEDPVRLAQEPTVAFSPSTLSMMEPGTGGRPHRLSVAFMGLFGPNGPLPLNLTEYARQRERHFKDPTFSRFLDVFHHRLLSLFYRAWADAQPHVHYDRPESDRYAMYVGSTFGIGQPGMQHRDEMPDLAKLYHGGHLACQTRSPERLKAMLADFFKLPVQIDEFIGKWTELPPECRCYLGVSPESSTLGKRSTIGSHVWDCQQKFRIVLGPMNWSEYERLLPSGSGLSRLVDVVKNYVGVELLWDLNLILKKEELPAAQLGTGATIGRSTWIDAESVNHDARDLVLRSHSG